MQNTSSRSSERRPDEATWKLIERTAHHVWTSGVAQAVKFQNESAVTLVLLKGWELGLPLMSSLEHVRLIHGRFSLSAECLQALVLARAPGAKFHWKHDGKNGVAEVVASRPGHADVAIRFTTDDAKATGLADRNPLFKTFAPNLLRASAMRHACRRLFPDIVLGVDLGSEPEEVEVPSADEEVDTAVPPPVDAPLNPPEAQLPPGVPRHGDAPEDVWQGTVPEDHKLPFSDGPWSGLCLSDLRAEDYPKMLRGFSSRLAKATEANDDKKVAAAELWLQRVRTWAAYRNVSLEA